ncbi:MAG: pectate lyase [Kiritimatiellae bacterium]|nr:pectate lyase [Kiritimatiellia bacterium]
MIEVTNLNSGGPGSLRAAIEAEGPRIVVFKVAGTIVLQSALQVANPYLTVAGQTAPGGGITLRARDVKARPMMNFSGAVHDVVVRYMRFRKGKDTAARKDEADNIQFRGGQNIVLDHCSLQWSTDENIGLHPNAGSSVRNVTVQQTIIAEGLRRHSCGVLTAGETCSDLAFYRNLFAHNAHRNPRIGVENVRVVNNVVYNWHSRVGNTHSQARADFIGNYYKAGPWSNPDVIFRHEYKLASPYPSLHLAGNIAIPKQPDPDADGRSLIRYSEHWKTNPKRFGQPPATIPAEAFRAAPLAPARFPEPILPAQAAYEAVLEDVGANRRLNAMGDWESMQDRVDRQIIEHVRNGTGPANDEENDHQDDYGGYPDIDPGTPYADSDHDGMPDAFESRHGLDPKDPADGAVDADGDGYTNVEEFLNGTNPTVRE